MPRPVVSYVDRFAGLSDRAVPLGITRIECPDCQDVDFTERTASRRPGYTRQNTTELRDSSVRLDGYNDYLRIPHIEQYDADTTGFAFEVMLNVQKSSESTIISRGFGTGADRYVQISYDPTINGGLGGWRLRAYDVTAATLRNVTINDGDADLSHIRKARHVELVLTDAGTSTYTFKVVDPSDGSDIGSTTAVIATWITNSQSYIIGCQSSDGISAPVAGDGSYAPISLSVLRIGGGLNEAALTVYGRELYEHAFATEYSGLQGYWKLNEGNGGVFADLVESNNAYASSEGPAWETDSSLVLGSSALRFRGDEGNIWWDLSAGSITSHVFTDTASGRRKWAVGGIFVPLMDQGETTVRDQTIFWSGGSTTDPAPLGLRVVSNQLRVYYRDGTSTKTATSTVNLSDHDGERVRWFIRYNDTATETVQLLVQRVVSGVVQGVIASVNTDGANPPGGSLSDNWSIGRLTTAFTYPPSYNDNSAFGIIDDITIFKDYSTGVGTGPSLWVSNAFQELTADLVQPGAGSNQGFITLVAGMRLNDGTGQVLETIGSLTSSAYLFPEEGDGIQFDIGFVESYDPAPITLIYDYRRVGPKGDLIRSKLVISGSTLYEDRGGTFEAVYGGLYKGGRWTVAQYGTVIYLGCRNGKRPMRYDGTSVTFAGIRAPYVAPAVTGATTGGSLSDGVYNVYYTFRNALTGVESNPSPTGTVTITGGGGSGRIDQIVLQRSGDPQVNQRRIYITAVGGGAGSTAYLSATVSNNLVGAYTDDITSVNVAGGVTLDYTNKEEPPVGNVVKVWKDRLYVCGVPLYPTRVFYSAVGSLEAFNQTTRYEDADLDSGDLATAMDETIDRLIVHFRDGRVALTATGDASAPHILSFLSRDHGAVGSHAVYRYEGTQFYLTETDAWAWDGANALNLSDPLESQRPAIKHTLRSTVSKARLFDAQVVGYRARGQLWFSVSTNGTYNDIVLVFDVTQGVWTKHKIEADYLAEIENTSDVSDLYFGQRGFLCKVDPDSTAEGRASFVGAISSATTSVITLAAGALGATNYKGCICYVWRASDDSVTERHVARNTTNTVTLDSVLTFTPSASDYIAIAVPQVYADFYSDFGQPMNLKRLRWLKSLHRAGASMSFRASILPKTPHRTLPTTGWSNRTSAAIGSSDEFVLADMNVGGLLRAAYLRFTVPVSATVPGTGGRAVFGSCPAWSLGEFRLEAEELDAR